MSRGFVKKDCQNFQFHSFSQNFKQYKFFNSSRPFSVPLTIIHIYHSFKTDINIHSHLLKYISEKHTKTKRAKKKKKKSQFFKQTSGEKSSVKMMNLRDTNLKMIVLYFNFLDDDSVSFSNV